MCAFSSSSSSSDSSSWQKSSSRQFPRSSREMNIVRRRRRAMAYKSTEKITVNEFLKEEEEQQQEPLGRWVRRAFSPPERVDEDGEDATFSQPSSSEQPRPRRTRVFRWLEQRLLQVLLPRRRQYQRQAEEEDDEEGQWLENFDAYERQQMNVFTRLREMMAAAFTRK
jgi:hypothetical protein